VPELEDVMAIERENGENARTVFQQIQGELDPNLATIETRRRAD
jgi:hypothetical protein